MFHFLFKGGGKDHQDQGDRGEDIGNNLGSFFNLSGVLRSGGVFGSGSGLVLLFGRVLSFSFVFDISNESTIMVGSIGHSLDATVRKVDPVGTCNERYTIQGQGQGLLALLENGQVEIFFRCVMCHCVLSQRMYAFFHPIRK